jgi:lipoprotein-anchoring transpeptidase ErfK/SrfK
MSSTPTHIPTPTQTQTQTPTQTDSSRPFRRAVASAVVAVSLLAVTVVVAPRADAAPARGRLTARTTTELAIYAERGDATPAATLPATTEFGTTRVVLVTKRVGAWAKVLLPERPNESTGWIRTAGVELRRVTDTVDVDLTARTLTWRRGPDVVLTTPIAIGASDTPTPPGRFYITDLLDTPDGGGYGPFAIGLSAHSFTLSEFAGGDGQIGVHGTSDPSSIGQAVSHGCVRVPNDVITQLATHLPLGTPVRVR